MRPMCDRAPPSSMDRMLMTGSAPTDAERAVRPAPVRPTSGIREISLQAINGTRARGALTIDALIEPTRGERG
jgi:hypothetical protein